VNAVISAVWLTAAASQHINFSITCVVEKLYAFEEIGLDYTAKITAFTASLLWGLAAAGAATEACAG
jgi:hypothetical protein